MDLVEEGREEVRGEEGETKEVTVAILDGLLRLNFLFQSSYFLLRFVRRDRSLESLPHELHHLFKECLHPVGRVRMKIEASDFS